jgi:hypothetical protein
VVGTAWRLLHLPRFGWHNLQQPGLKVVLRFFELDQTHSP